MASNEMTMPMSNPITSQIVTFLGEIGLEVRAGIIHEPTVLPGIQIAAGGLVVDDSKLLYPGDLLHEAGHLAVTSADERARLNGDVGQGPAEEMAAIAWSYAAARHLNLDPAVVFHAAGYRGGGKSLLENFSSGYYIGLPMVQWLGLALDDENARQAGLPAYPIMLKWLRD